MGSDTTDADAPPAQSTQAAKPFANQMVADFLALAYEVMDGVQQAMRSVQLTKTDKTPIKIDPLMVQRAVNEPNWKQFG